MCFSTLMDGCVLAPLWVGAFRVLAPVWVSVLVRWLEGNCPVVVSRLSGSRMSFVVDGRGRA